MTNLILQIENKLIVCYDNTVYLNDEALFMKKLILSRKESYERRSFNKEKQLHSFDDKPAVVWANGNQVWYQNGEFHRDNDKPAVVLANGNQYWYQHDKLHRDNDKPAIILANGSQIWYQNGKCHRDNNLPAVVDACGTQEWWRNGKLIKSS
jgi:hypothetical protein